MFHSNKQQETIKGTFFMTQLFNVMTVKKKTIQWFVLIAMTKVSMKDITLKCLMFMEVAVIVEMNQNGNNQGFVINISSGKSWIWKSMNSRKKYFWNTAITLCQYCAISIFKWESKRQQWNRINSINNALNSKSKRRNYWTGLYIKQIDFVANFWPLL